MSGVGKSTIAVARPNAEVNSFIPELAIKKPMSGRWSAFLAALMLAPTGQISAATTDHSLVERQLLISSVVSQQRKYLPRLRQQHLAVLSAEMADFISKNRVDTEFQDALKRSTVAALSFVQLVPMDVPLPWASHSEDGEIFLKWTLEEREAELCLSSDGLAGYAMLMEDSFVAGGEEASSSHFPTDLADYLRG